MINLIIQPEDELRVGDVLIKELKDKKWDKFQAAVAFVKLSGVKHIQPHLLNFSQRGLVEICVGINHGGTTLEGLKMLLDAVENRGSIYIFHNRNNSTFHPKFYLFRNQSSARVILGSNNLTEGGIYTNYEATVILDLSLNNKNDKKIINKLEDAISIWSDAKSRLSIKLTNEVLGTPALVRIVPTEKQARAQATAKQEDPGKQETNGSLADIFANKTTPRAPQTKVNAKYLDVSSRKQPKTKANTGIVTKTGTTKPHEEQKIILIKYVPKAGNRTSQVHFTLDNMHNYFRLKSSQHIKIMQKQLDMPSGDVEIRQLVLSEVNKNAKIEVGGAKILVNNYPKGEGKPVLIFKKIEEDSYEYMLIMPENNGYDQVNKYLSSLPKGRSLQSTTLTLEQMQEIWVNYK